MKYMHPLIFVAAGLVFLLISTVLYPPITNLLLSHQPPGDSPLPLWDLDWVLKAVRVIFFTVGAFFVLFGIYFQWLRKHLD